MASAVNLPYLQTNRTDINKAWQIAVGDVLGNVQPWQNGLLDTPRPCLMAGLDYDAPWTRDASINTWNAAALLWPQAARDTLLSCVEMKDGRPVIAGQYWDAIIWTLGAWHYYLCSGNRAFLQTAFDATANTLAHREETEFDPDTGLFRGGAVFQDGIAGYGNNYVRSAHAPSGIMSWVKQFPEHAASKGYGVPCQCLSTNACYARAYELAALMASELGQRADESWTSKAAALRAVINRLLWDDSRGTYRYYADPWGGCDHQEGMGHAFAIMLGIANEQQTQSILKHQHVSPAGVPCVWPSFDRYATDEGDVGRHAGTVWPHVQGFWADAALRSGATEIFLHELDALTRHANRDSQFTEIYHPETTQPYGGLQEDTRYGIRLWASCRRQTWSATAWLRMILHGILGLRADPNGLRLEPYLPDEMGPVEVSGIHYRGQTLHVVLRGSGRRVVKAMVDGANVASARIPEEGEGTREVLVELAS